MEAPLIAIVGSAEAQRPEYDPPLKNAGKVKQAMEELGRELANGGYRILVYSSSPSYIEADVVRGYIKSNVARPNSIQIRYPRGAASYSRFPEQGTQGALFEPIADTQPNWQVSFYESLKHAQGVLIVGGVSSALITGVMARLLGIPVLAIAAFGGSAENLWALMRDLANVTPEEHQLMGRDVWASDSAAKLIAAFGQQRQRLLAAKELARQEQLRDRRITRRRAGAMVALFLGAVVLLGFDLFRPVSSGWFAVLFFGVPLLAGASGGLARNVVELFQGASIPAGHDEYSAMALGSVGGFVSAILFVVAQWMSMPETVQQIMTGTVPWPVRVLVLFELVIGFTAGLTLEAVFTKLRGQDVLDVSPLKSAK
jgi:ABC-type multidrug transport system fused ATPase/permease subunit